ncbi:MAG: ubiquinol-cytochrome c reductase iron-sulfur subunit [Vicinamibacterales bacterium]
MKDGDAALTPLTAADITLNALAVTAWPFDLASKTVRSALRTNLVLLVRLVPETLSASTRRASLDGVVAYSALCSHAGCNLTTDQDLVVCDCHGSVFDPKDAGKVVEGPASRPLPILPLKIVDGALAVAGPFSAPIQFDQ